MAFDPLAIALYNEMRAAGAIEQPRVTAREILTKFIERSIDAVQGVPGSNCTSSEHWEVMECIAEKSVSTKVLTPPVETVHEWLASNRRSQALRELLKHSGLLWDDATARNLQYRHDRVRDRVLSYGMRRVALDDQKRELLLDPFFAEIAASALIDLGVECTLVKLFSKRAPLVLALALAMVRSGSDDEQRLKVGLRDWALAARNTQDVHSRLVFRALVRMDTPVILGLADVLPANDFDVLLARFRNGDAVAGIQFFGSRLGEPTASYADRDEAIAAVRRYHLTSLGDALSSLIPRLEEDRHRTDAIILCGFLATPKTLRLAMECWRSATDRHALLAASLWAQLSATGAPDEPSIDELLREYASLSDEEGEASMSERTAVHVYLQCSKPVMSAEMLAVLRDRTVPDETLRSLAWTLFPGVDHPTAVEVMSRLAADLEEQVKVEGGMPFGLMRFADEWTRGSRRMSTKATAHLRALWTRESESVSVRKWAFQLWLAGGAWDLNELVAVPVDGPFGDAAIWARAKRADPSCAQLVAERFAKSTRWASVVAQVWSDALRQVTETHMQNLGNPLSDRAHDVAQLLMRAPGQDARALLENHWERVRRSPCFIHAAIAIGGDRLQELVKEAIQSWPEGEESPFKHLTMHLHIHFEDEARFINQEVVQRLLPYIPRLEEFDVERIAEACRRRGFASWGRAYVAPLVSESVRRRVFPTEEDLKRELDDAVAMNDDRAGFPEGYVWAERARERVDKTIDLVNVIDGWLEHSSIPRRLGVAADALIEIGERRGIEVLNRRIDANNVQQQHLLNSATTLIRRRSLT
ncbi:MAG: hypothetical protein FWD69_09130 [Polyangiaceae bacterium]|nr:hypothetical protein [Polyangiaceae bacterium]